MQEGERLKTKLCVMLCYVLCYYDMLCYVLCYLDLGKKGLVTMNN